jgi:ATP-binding cassette, subfamily B (MDR/TAP), member 1
VINGVSTEGLGSILEAACAVITGVVIAFVFSWRMSCVCLILAPFAVITGYMGAKRASGLGEEQDQTQSLANLLAGDAIMNYRTVASFAHEEKILADYQALL